MGEQTAFLEKTNQLSRPYLQTASGVLNELRTDAKTGLDNHKVESRQHIYGKNVLTSSKKINPIVLFFAQFKSFIIYILLFALVISVAVGEYLDASVILTVLLFNAILGFVQEYKAEKSIEALKKLASLKAHVIRNSIQSVIDAEELVPGDIILLEEGGKIPADARLIESFSLEVAEASLTGESVPVAKHSDALTGKVALADRSNMIFSGTTVTRGRAVAVVVATGMQTELGKIAGLISSVADEATPLQKKLEKLGKTVGIITLAICAVVFLAGIWKEGLWQLLAQGEFWQFVIHAKDWLLTSVSLAVAAVPEGLPAIVTIALAIGVMKMLKKNSLIRKLPSIESMGEVTVICSDKTGTLTKNEMTVRKVYVNGNEFTISGSGYSNEGTVSGSCQLAEKDSILFSIGALCNNSKLVEDKGKIVVEGDPTEAALLVSARKACVRDIDAWKRMDEKPFDSSRKMMSVVCQKGKETMVFVKGAPEKVLDKCDRVLINGTVKKLTSELKEQFLVKNESFAKEALRVLGFAYKPYAKGELETGLIFVGLQGMIDPPHPEVADAITRCNAAGIRVIMITGDNKFTASAIAREIGIESEAMDGTDFAALELGEQFQTLKKISVFSRVEPEHKMLIVKLLQSRKEIVAMTGDGVNDAPAIKQADLGIAMGITGTDVTKEASDMILLNDNFTSIVNAIEEGRGIDLNIRKSVNYLLSCNLGEVFIILFAILLGLPLPMTAVMLLWMNLITDGLPALALSADPVPKDIMQKPPRKAGQGIMTKGTAIGIFVVSLLITASVLGIFYWALGEYSSLEEQLFIAKIQTLAFTALVIFELVRLQVVRSEYKVGLFSNKYLIFALIISLVLQLGVIYTPLNQLFGTVPLGVLDWSVIMGLGIALFVITYVGGRIWKRVTSD